MPKRELVIQLASGEPRIGLWCDACLSSAAYEIDLYRMADDGPHLIGTARRCVRCTDGE
jgi:hypothetical protein